MLLETSARDMDWTQSLLPRLWCRTCTFKSCETFSLLVSLSQPSAVLLKEPKNMRAFCWSRETAQNIADSIWCSFDCMRNQFGVAHAFTSGRAVLNLSDVKMSSCVWKQSAHDIGWTQSFLRRHWCRTCTFKSSKYFFCLKPSFHCDNTPMSM